MTALAASLVQTAESYVGKFQAVLKSPSASGLSLFFHNIVKELVAAADLDTVAGGAAKKVAVLAELSAVYDTYVLNIPLPWVPSIISRKLIAYAKPLVMSLASDLIEVTLTAIRSKVS
jgi:hypothetical protein